MHSNYSYKFFLPLIIIPLILVGIWFRNGLIMGRGEDGLPFASPAKTLETSGIWAEYSTGIINVGQLPRTTLFYPVFFMHEKLHIPNFILQAGTYFILLVVGMISCYFLTLKLLGQQQYKIKIALISSIFYLLNPFTISQVWGRSLTPLYFTFALFPLSILIFLLGLNKRKYIFAIFLTFSSLIFSTAFTFAHFIMVYWLVLVLALIFWIGSSTQKKKDFLFGSFFFVLSFFLWMMANFWWLQVYIPVNNLTLEHLGNFEGNLNSLIGVSRNFTPDLVVRLLQSGYFSNTGYYGKIYVSTPFQLISLLLPFFVIWGLIKVIRTDQLKQFRFFIILFTLGLFVSLGANPPLGKLFIWLFKKIALLQPFRNPYEKFGIVYTLGYASLFATGIVYFFRSRFKKWGPITVLLLTCVIFVWPIWTGRIFAGPDKKIGVPIPSYYQDLSEFLNKNSKDFRVFMTPMWSVEIPTFLWNDTIYLGSDPSLFLLNQPAIATNLQGSYYYDFILYVRRYMERINLAPALSLLRTKYLVDREDAIMIPDGEKLHYKFLTTAIQPPNDTSAVNRSVCQNMKVVSQDKNATRLICQISENEQDWQGVRYLHLEIKTDIASSLEVYIRDKKEVNNLWEGKVASEYQTKNSNWTDIIIPINDPTAYSYFNPIDLSHIYILDILAYPKDSQNARAVNLDLKEVKLDFGREVITHEFSLIKTFGKLKLYEPNNFKSPPEFGILSQVDNVDDFVELFQLVNQKRDLIDQIGFLLISQNPNKDLSALSKVTDIRIINKSKISETKYWIATGQNDGGGFLLLSKTFNSQWKAIPDVSKSELDGSFSNDLRLLKKSYLSENDHYVVNGYANLWKIDGNKEYAVVFMPQIMENIGSKVSIFSVAIMIGIVSIWGFPKLSRFYRR